MRANDPNLPHRRAVAVALGDLREQLVFVGGAGAGLLVTDPLADLADLGLLPDTYRKDLR